MLWNHPIRADGNRMLGVRRRDRLVDSYFGRRIPAPNVGLEPTRQGQAAPLAPFDKISARKLKRDLKEDSTKKAAFCLGQWQEWHRNHHLR